MKISIIDSSYPLSKMQYGVSASYLFWELSRHGITPTQLEDSDFVFATMQDPRQWPYLKSYGQSVPGKRSLLADQQAAHLILSAYIVIVMWWGMGKPS